jgi:hypothetical protein
VFLIQIIEPRTKKPLFMAFQQLAKEKNLFKKWPIFCNPKKIGIQAYFFGMSIIFSADEKKYNLLDSHKHQHNSSRYDYWLLIKSTMNAVIQKTGCV